MRLKESHRTSGTGLPVEHCSGRQLVRARCLELLTEGTRDQFWCETHVVMGQSTYTRCGDCLVILVSANTINVGAESYLCQYDLNGKIMSRRPDTDAPR